jgi:hypothetical protein
MRDLSTSGDQPMTAATANNHRDAARSEPVTAFPTAAWDSRLWAVTSYFNPVGYKRRLANYHLFRQNLKAPLLTVELAYGENFELADDAADILVRLRGTDVLWQKERLLNVALGHLPAACDKVALLDCDVVFELADWSERVSDLLDRFQLVQMFDHAHYMAADWIPGASGATAHQLTRPSLALIVAAGVPPATSLRAPAGAKYGRVAPGFAWAGRREVFAEHGIYDACIVGGAVSALASAAYGCFDHVMQIHAMNDRQRQHYLAWADRFYAAVRGEIAFLDCKLFHLWHGDFANRRYRERHEGLKPFAFDPAADIAMDESGCWRWNTNKPEMHGYVHAYLASRKEDG